MVHIIIDTKLLHYYGKGTIGTLTTIKRIVERATEKYPFKSRQLYFCADIGKSTYRSSLLPTYKSGRSYGDVEVYNEFKRTYNDELLPIAKLLGLVVFDIQGLEADDQASILANSLPKEDIKVLVTEDRDWTQTALGAINCFILSPATFHMWDKAYILDTQGLFTKDQFIAKKCILGDTGDSIRPSATMCGDKCFESFYSIYFSSDYTLDELKEKYLEFIGDAKKHKIHKDYLAIGINTFSDAWDLNVKLGTTFIDTSELTKDQLRSYIDKRTNHPRASYSKLNEFFMSTNGDINDFGGQLTFPKDVYEFFTEGYKC